MGSCAIAALASSVAANAAKQQRLPHDVLPLLSSAGVVARLDQRNLRKRTRRARSSNFELDLALGLECRKLSVGSKAGDNARDDKRGRTS